MGLIAGVFGWLSWTVWKETDIGGKIIMASTVLPMLLLMVVRAMFGVDEINVYGRRTRVRLRFLFRKSYGRRLMNEITTAVRRRQEAMARREVSTGPGPGPEVSTESLPAL